MAEAKLQKCTICYTKGVTADFTTIKTHPVCNRCVNVIEDLKKNIVDCRMRLKSCKGKPAIAVAFNPWKQVDTFYCIDCLYQTSNPGDIKKLREILNIPSPIKRICINEKAESGLDGMESKEKMESKQSSIDEMIQKKVCKFLDL